MAEVFEAELCGAHGFSRRVAIKKISAQLAGEPGRAVTAAATAWGMVVDRAVATDRRAAHRRALTNLVGAYQR